MLGIYPTVNWEVEELAEVADADAAQRQRCLVCVQTVACRVVALRQDRNLAVAQRHKEKKHNSHLRHNCR